jgi:hypothetical protein
MVPRDMLRTRKSPHKTLGHVIIGIIALSCSATYSIVDYTKIDLSIAPSINVPTRQRIYLISFAQGEVHERNQNYLALSAINKGILDESMGAGCFLETLKKIEPNDILLNVDAGAYLKGSVNPILERLNSPDTTMLLFENFHTNRQHVKRNTFDIMEVDYKHRDYLQLDAAFLAIKKTPAAYQFIEKWLEYCCIADAITDKLSKAPEFYEDEWKSLIDIFMHHRRRSANKPMRYFD